MKKVICLVLVLLTLLSGLPVFGADDIKVTINGRAVAFDVPPIIQEDEVLVPVRAIFEALSCDVYWMAGLDTVVITKNETKLILMIDMPSYITYTGYNIESFKKQLVLEDWTDIEEYFLDVPCQIVGNRTLAPLETLCYDIGVDFSWNVATNTAEITCEDSFIADKNTDKTFAGQLQAFLWDIKNGDISYEDYQTVKYQAGNLDILVELSIISDEELNKGGYITNMETLTTFFSLIGGSYNGYQLSRWYSDDELKPLDYLDDETKIMLLELSSNANRPILTREDMLTLEFNENLTNYQALKYVTRLLGNTYGCTDTPEELEFTEKSQTYQAAYDKGIIQTIDMNDADAPILRKDFYQLIHKAIFVVIDVGGYAPSKARFVDSLIERAERQEQPEEEEEEPAAIEIPIEAVINPDLSITWSVPEEYRQLIGADPMTDFATIDDQGVVDLQLGSASFSEKLYAEQFIELYAKHYPQNFEYLRCTYYDFDLETGFGQRYYFDIDISNISMKIEGTQIKPGVFTNFKRQWVPESISLAEGYTFKENNYYLITTYDHAHRVPEYNRVTHMVFRAYETANTLYHPDAPNGGQLFIIAGGLDLEEAHIQELTIKGNATQGYTICATPESNEIFTVVEGSEHTY